MGSSPRYHSGYKEEIGFALDVGKKERNFYWQLIMIRYLHNYNHIPSLLKCLLCPRFKISEILKHSGCLFEKNRSDAYHSDPLWDLMKSSKY